MNVSHKRPFAAEEESRTYTKGSLPESTFLCCVATSNDADLNKKQIPTYSFCEKERPSSFPPRPIFIRVPRS